MRTLIALLVSVALAWAVPEGKHPAAAVRAGVKTAGVQIPFSSLKPEATFPVARGWIAFAGLVLVPNDAGDGLDRIDAKANKMAEPISGLSRPCGGVATGFGSLWVPNCGDGTLARLDPKTGKIVSKIASGVSSAQPAIASDADSIWLLTDDKTTLSRLDPQQNQVVAELRLPSNCNSLTFAENALWVTCPRDGRLLRIDPRTNLVDKRIEVSGEPVALASGAGSLWVLCRKEGKVDRVDPKTNKVVKTIDLGVPGASGSIAAGAGSVWVTLSGFPLTRIDPESDKVVQQFYGTGGGAILIDKDSVWLANTQEKSLWRIDPKRVAATLAE